MKNKKRSGRGIWFVLALLVIGTVVYLAASGSLDDWMDNSIFAGIVPTPTPTAGTEKKTVSLILPETEYYAVQSGVYEVSANAFENASKLQKRGAAGFVEDDTGSGYRVFVAAYSSQTDADAVKARLQSEEKMNTFIYKISTDRVSMSVTATDKQIDAIKAGLEGLSRIIGKFETMSVQFDCGGIDTELMRTRLTEMSTECRTIASTVGDALKQNGTSKLNGLVTVYEQFVGKMDNLKNVDETDKTVLSSQIKYLFIDMIRSYCEFIDNLQ